MKAIRVHAFGDPEVLKLEDVPDPKPGPGQVLIDVKAVGSAREAVRGADILSSCTDAMSAVYDADWIEPGMHVTNLTSADVQPNLPQVVDVVVRAGEATPRLANRPGSSATSTS